MRCLIQRVSRAAVRVEDTTQAAIQRGYLLFLCVEQQDDVADIEPAVQKILQLRLFPGEQAPLKPMDRSIEEVGGSILVVSQFTLAARVQKGRRPSFDRAMPPAPARVLYDRFVEVLSNRGLVVRSGIFGANMQVELTNDGPVTLAFRVRDAKVHNEPDL